MPAGAAPTRYSEVTPHDAKRKKKINNPLKVVREYRISQHSTTSRSLAGPGDPTQRARKILFALSGTLLASMIAVLLQIITLFSNNWGSYRIQIDGFVIESGTFGLWRICVDKVRGSEVTGGCGVTEPDKFTLPAWCMFAGICAVLCLTFLVICASIAVVQVIHLYRQEPPVCPNKGLLSQKIIPIILSAVTVSTCLVFVALAMKRAKNADTAYAAGFWTQCAAVFFVVVMLICTAVESLWRPLPFAKERPKLPSKVTSDSTPTRRSFYYKTPGEDPRSLLGSAKETLEIVVEQRRVPGTPGVFYRRSLSEGAAQMFKISRFEWNEF